MSQPGAADAAMADITAVVAQMEGGERAAEVPAPLSLSAAAATSALATPDNSHSAGAGAAEAAQPSKRLAAASALAEQATLEASNEQPLPTVVPWLPQLTSTPGSKLLGGGGTGAGTVVNGAGQPVAEKSLQNGDGAAGADGGGGGFASADTLGDKFAAAASRQLQSAGGP